MSRWLLPALVFVLAVIAGGYAVLHALPGFIMDKAMTRIAGTTGGELAAHHAPPLTPENQTVVRASPDILYSICSYDLAGGDVLIEAPWPQDGSYASVSLYDARTNNFFVVSDRDGGSAATLVLTRQPSGTVHDPRSDTSQVPVFSPTDRGLILYRRVVEDPARLDRAVAHRRGFSCSRMADR